MPHPQMELLVPEIHMPFFLEESYVQSEVQPATNTYLTIEINVEEPNSMNTAYVEQISTYIAPDLMTNYPEMATTSEHCDTFGKENLEIDSVIDEIQTMEVVKVNNPNTTKLHEDRIELYKELHSVYEVSNQKILVQTSEIASESNQIDTNFIYQVDGTSEIDLSQNDLTNILTAKNEQKTLIAAEYAVETPNEIELEAKEVHNNLEITRSNIDLTCQSETETYTHDTAELIDDKYHVETGVAKIAIDDNISFTSSEHLVLEHADNNNTIFTQNYIVPTEIEDSALENKETTISKSNNLAENTTSISVDSKKSDTKATEHQTDHVTDDLTINPTTLTVILTKESEKVDTSTAVINEHAIALDELVPFKIMRPEALSSKLENHVPHHTMEIAKVSVSINAEDMGLNVQDLNSQGKMGNFTCN